MSLSICQFNKTYTFYEDGSLESNGTICSFSIEVHDDISVGSYHRIGEIEAENCETTIFEHKTPFVFIHGMGCDEQCSLKLRKIMDAD